MLFTHDTEASLLAAVALVNSAAEPDTMTTVGELTAFLDEHEFTGRRVGDDAELAAVRDLLPTIVWDRPKQGFTLPFDRWMRRELHDEMESVFTLTLAGAVGMEPGAVRRVWEDFQLRRNGVTWSRAWALYTLLRWARDNEARLAVPERVARPRARAMVEA